MYLANDLIRITIAKIVPSEETKHQSLVTYHWKNIWNGHVFHTQLELQRPVSYTSMHTR